MKVSLAALCLRVDVVVAVAVQAPEVVEAVEAAEDAGPAEVVAAASGAVDAALVGSG